MKTKKILFISSCGGHLDELLQLKPMFENYNYHIVTEHTDSTVNLHKKFPNKVDYLVYGTRFELKKYIFKFSFNCLKTIYLFFKIRPTVIITTGAHTAVPMCYFGKFAGAKVIFIESFANLNTKTLSGRLVYPLADKFIVQWESTQNLYKKAILGGWIY
ncbi:MAG: polysaccharide biosynthesis protein [Bacilli bacterium]|nr:polysaccharide biosynthesis protein [Bacilli bacterium]